MIIICDLSYKTGSLSNYEYVKPIEEIVKTSGMKFKTVHYSLLSKNDLKNADGLILCGTALKDNKFLEDLSIFNFIKDLKFPVLGICAGIQVIAGIFGGNITANKKIGMTKVKKIKDDLLLKEMSEFEAYELHINSIDVPEDFLILAESDSGVQAVKHEEKLVYGVVFHPEVRNEQVVFNFLEVVRKASNPV
ncbi:MAG: gamma-glutamyl-gamma-aminobutyrate hydrolase family protein [Methanomicrobium sp.]|nr:gamma-glutamyl-gamma-aminobutyrate hydrolase family protein [Methanomicrobium sp.]